jgi:hypothetical protein
MCGDGKQSYRDPSVDEDHPTREELKARKKPHVRETEEMQFITDTMR